MEEKTCKKCQRILSLDHFYKRRDKNNVQRIDVRCKECVKSNRPQKENKTCNICRKTLSINNFYNKSGYPSSCCKDCFKNKGKDAIVNSEIFKICSVCKRELPLTDFYKAKRCKIGVRERCKNCHTLAKAQCKDNWDTSNLTPDFYENMLDKQNGVCAICGTSKPYSDKTNKIRFAVDHNHTTGKTRGLLCNRCNHGIGQFLDNPYIIFAAYKYIMDYDYSG